jgi:uncharacterized Zn-binding protein involved in type VI secretion
MKKAILASVLILILLLPLAGCAYPPDGDMLNALLAWLNDYKKNGQDGSDSDGDTGPVALKLTYPVGRSPNVFTTGWVFGASCNADGKDYSDQVKWSGSGSFEPNVGTRSRPSFNSTGSNAITLSVTINGKDTTKTFTVNAVSPAGYACVGMLAHCPSDSHGCLACAHDVRGPITTGSSHVFVNGRPAARVGDRGTHAACCGPNTFTIVGGDSSVLIDGKPAARVGSQTQHCGGKGTIIGGGD